MPSLLRRRSEPRRRTVPLAIGLAGAGAVLATVLIASGGEDEPSRPAGASASSAEVERRTLVARELVDGTLGYAGSRTVINRLGGSDSSGADGGGADPAADSGSGDPSAGGSKTLTALARPGSVIRRGGALFRVDSEPVVLMYGSTPAYRDLEEGIEAGRDVLQLEENLVALGFDPGVVDETFSSDTAAAVRDWQESQELEETGAVELGRVVFLPGPRRIGERKASVGTLLGDGSEVLDTSSTRRVVAIELDASLQSIARRGDGVEVTLPSGSTTRGRVESVGRVAREKASEDAATDPNAEAELVIDVTVELRGKRRLGRYDEAPVSVGLAQDSRRNVLAVPVNALVALRGGGYGVELAGSRRIVPVDAGMFADGLVEISGSGIRAGTRVVVPDE
jgi:peptidoglycan hydrolase-like protein with peptidoglycan-binding domain